MSIAKVGLKIANYINNGKGAQKFLKKVNKNPAIYNAGASLVLASLMRPSAMFILPIKNEKDKKVSISSSVATGLVELISTLALFIPLNKIIEKTSQTLYNSKNNFFANNNLALRTYKSLNNRFLKLMSLPLLSVLRFTLVPHLNKFLFKPTTNTQEKKWK